MGETIPKETNTLTLDKSKTDEWGIPLIHFNVDYDDNDDKMVKDYELGAASVERYIRMVKKAQGKGFFARLFS